MRTTMTRREKVFARIRHASRRDIAIIGIAALLLIVGSFWGAAQFTLPAPPKRLVIASGPGGGAYQRYAAEYKQYFDKFGIELVERPTSGSVENVKLLRDDSQEVDAGFVQGGSSATVEDDGLMSLGALYYEPLWIFYREAISPKQQLEHVAELKGKRIAVGAEGGGNRQLATEILHANNLDEGAAKLVSLGGLDAATALIGGKVDAAMVVGPTQSAAVWLLLYTPGIRVLNLANAETYVRMFPYLSAVVLPAGAIDLVKNIPSHDIHLVAPMATIAVRAGTHPAHIDLLLQAVSDAHKRPGIFNRPGEFPKAQGVDFPLAPAADRFYKSGKPFLQRYLPFWVATLVDRLVVMLIPLFVIMVPVLRFAPSVYNWRARSRIYRHYGELKFLEAEVEAEPQRHTRAEWLEKLEAIERVVNRIPVPLAFSDMLYTLRQHLQLARETILKNTKDNAVTESEPSPAAR